MAYNNYMFPQGYYPAIIPQYQQTVPQIQQNVPQQQAQLQNNGIIWVQGEQAAKGYPVAPNQSVLLMDSEQSAFYIKSADNAGMPQPLRIFDYSERNTNPVPVQQVTQQSEQNFVTHAEFEEKLDEIKSMIKATTKEKKTNAKSSLNMQNLAASQTAQTAQILANNAAQTQALEQYLNPAPIPAYVVQNPNCCPTQNNCGCNCGCGVG